MRIIERSGPLLKLFRGEGAWGFFSPARFVLSWGYRLFLAVRAPLSQPARAQPPRRGRREGVPVPLVVSIGNLEVGGGGKTPCALRLAEEIRDRGGTPVVLSRGYGGAIGARFSRCMPFAMPPGTNPDRDALATREIRLGQFLDRLKRSSEQIPLHTLAASAGDEILLYRARGIAVVIDRDRLRGAGWAMERFSPTHLLLDDGYHVSSLRKDLDILLLDAERPFGTGRLLPLGTLREAPRAAARADVVIFTRALEQRIPPDAEPFVKGKLICFAAHEPVDFMRRGGESAPLSVVRDRDVVIFSGIARPAPFESLVASLGARAARAFRFIDHHRYTARDVARMLRGSGQDSAFVTTEKDWIKAAELFPAGIDVLALRIRMRISDMDLLMERLFHVSDTHLD